MMVGQMKKRIQLSDHFDYRRLLRFTFPSVIMLVFTSIYGVVDGFFVSNFAGKTPFAAVNFIMPLLLILGCVGFMFGTGGSALIAKTMGEGRKEKAQEIFSMIVYVSIVSGIVLLCISQADGTADGCTGAVIGRQYCLWKNHFGSSAFLCLTV